ncbi:MAG: tetratricopeptide repeat protein [Lachnospiraceae bacterium]|nr:tetratricopeptide repeat protein [Lachnospiraceae bacterium]MBQ7780449.1 tetratricopeptide repeat protein [Lachnospiraceae bacterium]
MNCYNCGCRLSEHDFCTGCGVDVSVYKKILKISNMYYNEGLERAGVRDLTGAIVSLRQSLKFNKNNVEARNLLGLVYFEMGEVVAALSEWVISKNLRPQKNIADDYIDMIQNNAARLDTINQTIKKYNQALVYCKQDSKDLAVIQLKKVLSLNPRFIRAHQLLALLYIDIEQWEKAKRELEKCRRIDANNTQTLRYLKEVESMLNPDEPVKGGKRKNEESVRYQSDNEIIIQPLNVKEPKNNGLSTLFNVAIGLVLGIAAMFFLVLPSAVSSEREKAQAEVREIGSQLDVKTATIDTMQQEIDSLTADKKKLEDELAAYVGPDGTIETIDSLLQAAAEYLQTGDAMATAEYLNTIAAEVNMEETSDGFKQLYDSLLAKIGPELSVTYYTSGNEAYQDGDYETAIADLVKAVNYDATNGDALFTLGNAYRRSERNAEAVAVYEKVLELFPGTERARRAQHYIDEINGD